MKEVNTIGSCQWESPEIEEEAKVGSVLRVNVQTESKAAKAYYRQGEYYAVGLEIPGEWQGLGAERLGLTGEVMKADFAALCDNLDPKTRQPLTARTKQNRRVLTDLNFHVPKSVSVVYGLTGDDSILRAFQNAITETMSEVEAGVKTRVRKGGLEETRITGNLVYSQFVHTTARPVDGIPDPHLHAHCTVFNATFDPIEQQWKAAELSDVYSHAPYFEAAFHSRLALALTQLGFDVTPTRTGWELSGIPDRVLDCFSRRTAEIERTAAALGITDPNQKDQLGAKTRRGKLKHLTLGQLRTEWWSRLTTDEHRALRAVFDRLLLLSEPDPRAASQALAWAMEHCFERESVMPSQKLLTAALRHGYGSVSISDLKTELLRDGNGLIHRELDGQPSVTTHDVLAEERRMLAFAREGRGQCRAFAEKLSAIGVRDELLSLSQRAVVRHILESTDRVILIRGAAGTGKTALMKTAVDAIRLTGKQVVTLAPSADASRGVLRSEGFTDADTLSKFLLDPFQQDEARGQVIWVDEAGLVGTRTLADLFRQAEWLDARVILSGDVRQHGPVERGLPLRLLETDAGLVFAELKEIRRQSGVYKEAVQLLSEGQTLDGFDRLDALGWVRDVAALDRNAQLASEFLANRLAGKTTLVVAPTHLEGQQVTETIRSTLRSAGLLTGEEVNLSRLEAKDLTVAERRVPVNYQVGDVIEFHQRAKGYAIGVRYRVVGVGSSSVAVEDPTGQLKLLPLTHADRLTVYTSSTISVAVGDSIRITKNGWSVGATHRLDNGRIDTVSGFTSAGEVELASGIVVRPDFAHLNHGYAVTSHASQGKTVDRVLLAVSSKSFPAVGREQFYVSVSRARERATIYTDDALALRTAIQRSDPRTSASELVFAPPVAVWKAWVARHQKMRRDRSSCELPIDPINRDQPVRVGS